MDILRRLADPRASFASETLRRAQGYARLVSAPDLHELDPSHVTASATVQGTRPAPYVVHLEARLQAGALRVATSCSCPVGGQCKHGAAVALSLGRLFGGTAVASDPEAPTPSAQAELERLLHDLGDLAPPDTERPGLALEFALVPRRQRLAPSGTQTAHRVTVRPMRPGTRQAWVKTGMAWGDVQTALQAGRFDHAQLQALARIRTLVMGDGWYSPRGDATLDDLGPAAAELLGAAQIAGVTFLAVGELAAVQVLDTALSIAVDAAAAAHGRTELHVGLRHRERLWSGEEVAVYGTPAGSVSLLDHDGRLVIARLDPPLGSGPVRALTRARPVVVPGEQVDVVPDLLRRLRGLLPVESADGSVEVPEPIAPTLRVSVTWDGAGAADVAWEWVYEPHPPFAVGGGASTIPRDRPAEAVVLSRLDPPPQPRCRVIGADALHLALLQLPVWRETDGVEVVEIDAPDFREATEGPRISFETPSDPDDEVADPHHTDWLDLDVLITVEGERVLLAHVLQALTLGDEHVILPSGLYVATDRPEFGMLDDLVRAAEQLHERRAEQVRVSRHDLGVLSGLADLGPVAEQAHDWVRRAQSLRDLDHVEVPDPPGVVSTLRPYQRDGVTWLALLWRHGLGGVLADDMGLGKTLQVLSLVAHARYLEPETPPFLVVAPTSVVSAWVGEAARHTPGLVVRAVTSSQARRGKTLAEVADDADVVVTTYTLLRLEAEAYTELSWSGLVLDEAQQVKNHRSKAYAAARAIRTPFRLAVTGTPFENRLLELWALLSIVAPGLYPHSRQFVEHVVTPVEKQGDAAALRRFTRRIRPFVLRRTKEVVAADLPAKQEQVLAVELSPRHRRLYDTHLTEERQRILGLVDDFDTNRVAILAALTRLRQLALDPALVDAEQEGVGSAKIDQLVEYLREVRDEGHRALVFSQFTGFLGRVRTRLIDEGIETAYLDGRTRDRPSVIEGFRNGDAPVFLISLKAGGVGLTLTEADYVFVLDPWWNPAAEAQAVDRAHRIGQQRTVMVYRLVATDTIEDKVMALKARKAALFAQVIGASGTEGGEAGAGVLAEGITAEDIRGLFDT